jgi:DDE superfamily endonuclease
VRRGLPLARWSLAELRREVMAQGLVAQISGATLWRWLSQDALRPWRHRSWIFPRDPAFAAKAGRILDLYERRWQGVPLGPRDYVLCADEQTRIQVRRRRHPTLPPRSGRPMDVEHEYERGGAWAYLAAWDVHRAKVFGRCEPQTGIAPFERLVAHVMGHEPYRSARRVFWIVDNGSGHRASPPSPGCRRAGRRPRSSTRRSHASWLNQIEIYFSIVQRKVLTPNDFRSLTAVKDRLLHFQTHYEATASPFQWTFTRRDLHRLLAKLAPRSRRLAA